MTLRVYNTLTKQKELFEPVKPGEVGMYLCGPTVYKEPHIGHMVGPVIFDAVKRYLQYKGFKVTWVVNITDVDDKLIDAAAKQNTNVKDLAERHTKGYFEVLAAMGIESVDKFPKASEHMAEIIDITQRLIDNGHAYAAEGNVWFDVAKDADYGKLSNRRVEEQEGTREGLESAGKRNRADFALWKAAKPGEPAWDSPWGAGRPGWHVECSAMSMKYLGQTFDVHGGGMDLMFPHHENELAQSESCTGKPFVKYWLHNGLTKLRTKAAGGEWQAADIHETAGNAAAVRARELIARHGADVLRYLLLSAHYRSPIEFGDEALANAKKALAVFQRLTERVERLTGQPAGAKTAEGKPPPDMDGVASALFDGEHAPLAKSVLALKMKFLETMDDDFNTAGAIGVLHEMAGEVNGFIERAGVEKGKQPEAVAAAAAAAQTVRNLGQILGLKFQPPAARGGNDTLNKVMDLVIRLRNEARQAKNFALADAIRNGLTEVGVTLEDGPEGTRWRKD